MFVLSVKWIKIAWVHREMSRFLEHTIFIKRWAKEYLYDYSRVVSLVFFLCLAAFLFMFIGHHQFKFYARSLSHFRLFCQTLSSFAVALFRFDLAKIT